VNSTPASRFASNVRLTDFHLIRSTGTGAAVRLSAASPPNIVEVAAFESVVLPLTLTTGDGKKVDDLRPGTYRGVLFATDTDKSTGGKAQQISGNIVFVVPPPAPAVSSMTLWVYRSCPWGVAQNYTFNVPLAQKANPDLDEQRFVLQNDDGVLATVHRTALDKAGPIEDFPFRIDRLTDAGKYQGKIAVSAGTSGALQVNVNLTDHAAWPFLTMLLGVLIAQFAKQVLKYSAKAKSDKESTSFILYVLFPSSGEVLRTLIALLIAFVTAFKSFYVGRPFGTSMDYINMFLSGTAVKLSVDFVAFAALRLTGRSPS